MTEKRVTQESLFITDRGDFPIHLHVKKYFYCKAFNLIWQLLLCFDYWWTAWLKFNKFVFYVLTRAFLYFRCFPNMFWNVSDIGVVCTNLKPTLYGFFLQGIYEYQKVRHCSAFCSQALERRTKQPSVKAVNVCTRTLHKWCSSTGQLPIGGASYRCTVFLCLRL